MLCLCVKASKDYMKQHLRSILRRINKKESKNIIEDKA